MRTYTVNKNLRRIVDERHISHARLAEAVGIRRDTFSRILNCKRPLFADEVGPIALELGIPLEELFAEDKEAV